MVASTFAQFSKFYAFWPGWPPGLHTQVGAISALESGAGGFAECKNKPTRPHLTGMTEEDLRTECLRLEIPAGGLDKSALQRQLLGHILDPPEVDVPIVISFEIELKMISLRTVRGQCVSTPTCW